MDKMQLEMFMLMLMFMACIIQIILVVCRRVKKQGSKFDFIIVSCSIICMILGAMFGIIVTSI